MPNEREVKLGLTKISVCSVSGKRCVCESGAGCARVSGAKGGGEEMVEITGEVLRWIRTASLHVDISIADVNEAIGKPIMGRAYPGPELREVKRKLEAAKKILDEI
jgi:hypothetical protein